MCEKFLADFVELLQYTQWEKVFFDVYKKLAKDSNSEDDIHEIPKIPFTNSHQIYTGKIVRKDQYVLFFSSAGLQNHLKHLATVNINKEVKGVVKLFRRIYTTREIHNYSCGTIYEGSYREGKKDGYGILKLSSGDIYEGEFSNNFQDGVGIMKNFTENGSCIVYEGDWEMGLRDGYGIYNCSDGTNFSGQWEKGKQFYGIFNGSQGHRYMGFWDGNKMDQKGVFYDPVGKVYKGEFEKGVFKGIGELKQGDMRIAGHFDKDKVNRQGIIEHGKYTYNGDLIRDKPHGWGIKNWKNGDEYKGYFKNGYECGEGTLTKKNGDIYNGNFDQGVFNGKGIYKFSNGNLYEGEFKDGKMKGYGKIVYSSEGDLQKIDYEGQFENNLPHGKGVLRLENGSIYRGEFKEGKMCGKGKMDIKRIKGEDEGNQIYEGEFFDDLFEGYGIYYENKRIVYKGYWRYGKKHGQAEFMDNDGIMQHGLFCNDALLKNDREMY